MNKSMVKKIALFDESDAPFAMSPKDLKLIESIPHMIEIGIDSFKSRRTHEIDSLYCNSYYCLS